MGESIKHIDEHDILIYTYIEIKGGMFEGGTATLK